MDPNAISIMSTLEACLEKLSILKQVHVMDPVISPHPIPNIDRETGNFFFKFVSVRLELVCYLTENLVLAHEFKFSINKYLQNDVNHFETKLGRKIFTLADVIKYNELNPVIEGFGQLKLKLAEATDGLQNRTYLNARIERRSNSIMYLESIFEKYGVDALATPCESDYSIPLFAYGAHSGYPSISVST